MNKKLPSTQLKAMLGHKAHQGFTLLELMITVGIVSILASIAYPSYSSYTKRSYRADATSALMQAASALERFRTANNTYVGASFGGTGTVVFPNEAPLDGNRKLYDLVITTQTANTYTIEAVPKSTATLNGDWTYTLQHTGLKQHKSGTGAATEGWELRLDP